MFRLAHDMHDRQQPRQPSSAAVEHQVSAVQEPRAQWREILEEAQLDAENDIDPATEKAAFYADADDTLTTAALPDKPASKGETIAITFDASLSTLAKDDDLRVRLMRHGKRHPETIIIGKVEGVQGFAAMQKALALGKVIADASGGNPGMSYDPALSPRTAELYYPKPGHAQ